MQFRTWSNCLAACALLIGCADTEPSQPGGVVAVSVDHRGLPRMLQAHGLAPAPAPTAMESARIHIERLAGEWGVAPGTLPTLKEVGEVPVPGGTIARIAQTIDGLPVWGRELRVLVHPDGQLATASGTLIGTLTPRVRPHFSYDEPAAIDRAVVATYGARDGVRVERAQAKQVWYPVADRLVAAWLVDAYTSRATGKAGDAYRTIFDGASGQVLAHYSLVADAAFQYSVFAETTGEKHPLDGPIVDSTPHPTGVPDGFYPAYLAGPNLVTVDSLSKSGDPWLTADATATTGNNVDAYVDFNQPNGLTDGDFRAEVTEAGKFGYVYDTAIGPLDSLTQQKAAITSLFYVLNWLHDFWYDAGFVETAGNAQALNYMRGGVEGDPVLGEAQDNALGGSRNNANMATPDDGMSPRMQVYLWSGKDERSLTLSPSNRTPPTGAASWGPKDFDLSGVLVIGNDGAGVNPTDGCTALVGDVSGKIVVVDRGNCTFKTKAVSVQNAGGIGMVLVNNQASTSPPGMGDDSSITTTITIAALSVTDTEGAMIKADVNAGTVTATMHRKQFQELEGSLDSTLIAHEFGHYIHHRLSFCENKMCRAMSEGWGDFSALLLLAREGDNLDGAFPFSVYTTQSFSSDPAYFGIRRAPYSVDFAINSLSYRHMADGEPTPTTHPFNPSNANSEVHNAGEIWAQVLWDGYVGLQKAGTDFNAVRLKMAQYVVAGLLLAPNEASPMETRNAILAAVLASNPADHDILMKAFARRGFGSCAVAPPPDSVDFTELRESTIVAGNAQLAAVVLDDNCDADGVLDSGETATLKIRVANQGHAQLTDVKLEVTSAAPGVTVMSPPTTLATLDQFASTDLEVEVKLDGASAPVAGDLSLAVTSTGGCEPTATFPIAFRLNTDDKPESSTTDTFDTVGSVWEPWTAAWHHVRESALDGAWHGDDLAVGSDARLTSPQLLASDSAPLVITFQHAYSFEASNGQNWDGGAIEYTVDNGETWQDVTTLGVAPGYTGMIATDSGNELADRMAYTAQSAVYPELEPVTLDFGKQLAGKAFRIRFRLSTDAGTGAPGWTVDNVAFSGIVGKPFPTQVADDGVCGPPQDPIVSGGGGCCDAGPLHTASLGLSLGVLGLVLRRRRRR
ncbi:MAG TPA: M36 family metallopeptidase [Kofleriaceae bacterium]